MTFTDEFRRNLAAGYTLREGSRIILDRLTAQLVDKAGDGLSRAFPSPAESPHQGVPPVHPLPRGRDATPNRRAA